MNEKEKLKVLSLFAGIGGIDLGLESTGRFETIQFVEYEPFCQHILRRHWPDVPIWGDVKTFDPDSCGDIDLLCGGYPCQPFSVAGKQKGTEDDRHLWPRMFEIIKHKRPTWVLCENVPGHVNLGLDQVLFDLESEGYSWQTFVLGAVAVDAPHRRQRLFIVANTDSEARGNTRGSGETERKLQPQEQEGSTMGSKVTGCGGLRGEADVADTKSKRSGESRILNKTQRQKRSGKTQLNRGSKNVSDTISERGCSGQTGNQDAEDVGEQPRGKEHGERSIERGLGGMVDGVPSWLHEPDIPRVTTHQVGRTQRLKALGNAVVPQVIAQIARAIIIEEDR